MRILRIVVILCICALMTACYDRVELEKRGFIGAFGIDLADGEIIINAELLALKSEAPDNGAEGKSDKTLLKASGTSFSEAADRLNDNNAKALNLGLSKACLLGEALLADNIKLREVVSALKKNAEISDKLILLAVRGETGKVMKKGVRGENSLGYYVANYYKHAKGKYPAAALLELETLAGALRESKGALVPVLLYDENAEKHIFSGAALVSDKLVGFTEDERLNGIAWVKGLGRGRVLTEQSRNASSSIKITAQKADFSFRAEDNAVICDINIKADSDIAEHSDNADIPFLEELYADIITEEVRETAIYLYDFGIDGYGLGEMLYKRHPSIYEGYGDSPCIINITTSLTITK